MGRWDILDEGHDHEERVWSETEVFTTWSVFLVCRQMINEEPLKILPNVTTHCRQLQ